MSRPFRTERESRPFEGRSIPFRERSLPTGMMSNFVSRSVPPTDDEPSVDEPSVPPGERSPAGSADRRPSVTSEEGSVAVSVGSSVPELPQVMQSEPAVQEGPPEFRMNKSYGFSGEYENELLSSQISQLLGACTGNGRLKSILRVSKLF